MKAIKELLDNINFTGNAANVVLKIVVGVLGGAVVGAFILGQVKTKTINQLDDIEELANQSIYKIETLETKMDDGFKRQDEKINRLYIDGISAFETYNDFHKNQLKLILKYGKTNKELLIEMLDMNAKEKAREIENNINNAKRKSNNIPKIDSITKARVFVVTDTQTGVSTYNVVNAPENYLDTLNLTKYKIIDKKLSDKYPNLFDFKYIDIN